MSKHVIPIKAWLVFDDDTAYREFIAASKSHERRRTVGSLLDSKAAQLETPEVELDHEMFEALGDHDAAWMTEAAVAQFVGDDTAQLRQGNRTLRALMRILLAPNNAGTILPQNSLTRVRVRRVMVGDSLRIDGLYVPDLQRLCREPERAAVIKHVTGFGERAMRFLERFVESAQSEMARSHDAGIASLLGITNDEATKLTNAVIGHGVGMDPEEVGRIRH